MSINPFYMSNIDEKFHLFYEEMSLLLTGVVLDIVQLVSLNCDQLVHLQASLHFYLRSRAASPIIKW